MSRTGTSEAFRKNVELNVVEYLRGYADAAEASGSRHWAVAMREAVKQLQWPLDHAMKINGVGKDDLHVCGACEGTGYVA